jgi:flagellar M-ring protein FliF
LRLKLATSGTITSGGVGFEIFDKSQLGTTDFDRQVNYLRALQEELRRTIIQFDEVEQARVHLVLPEKSVFVEDEKPASASVALKLKPIKKLSNEQVQGIVLLVSSSVEGLKPENVSVVDMAGNVLSDNEAGDTTVGMANQSVKRQDIKKALETQLEQQVKTMTDKIFGPGKAIVVINTDLDFSQHEKRSVTYGKNVVRSETGVTESRGTSSAGASGVPGTDSNVPEYDAVEPGNSGNTSTGGNNGYVENTRNYEVDTTEEKYVFAPGEIKRISAAIVVDGYLSPEKTQEVQNLVASAVGLQPDRGDMLTVSSMSFDTTEQDDIDKSIAEYEKKEKELQQKEAIRFWVLVGTGLLGVIILAIIFRVAQKKKSSALVDKIIDEPVAVEEIPIKPISDDIVTNSEAEAFKKQQDKAKKYIEEKPEEAANILKTWLNFEE